MKPFKLRTPLTTFQPRSLDCFQTNSKALDGEAISHPHRNFTLGPDLWAVHICFPALNLPVAAAAAETMAALQLLNQRGEIGVKVMKSHSLSRGFFYFQIP